MGRLGLRASAATGSPWVQSGGRCADQAVTVTRVERVSGRGDSGSDARGALENKGSRPGAALRQDPSLKRWRRARYRLQVDPKPRSAWIRQVVPLLGGLEEDARSVQAKLALRSQYVGLYFTVFLLRGVVSLILTSFTLCSF